ncbi:MAG: S-layer family protein [Xenococcaceae cyanobacterium MO_207.B15]|nr:S-layer family protein [Xenococcaceae cyanobacterium MO_207.B15]
MSGILTLWFPGFRGKNSQLLAEITPDTSLNSENSVVTPGTVNDLPADIIEGGAERGANLFHSFLEFSVNQGQQVYFQGSDFQNIFSRVTGNNPSNILGTLGVLGNADLFLINPNGIIFGQNAQLDVNGSFISSTADSVIFDNNFAFSASNPQAPPLLTINIPLGLQYGLEPAKIVNRSQAGTNLFGLPAGLEVQQNQTLALVGGNLELEAGRITAEEGRIELGSVADNSFVSLTSTNPGWSLGYEEVQDFQNILLSQEAIVLNISNEQAGEIQIQGRQITLQEGAQIVSANIGAEVGGKLDVSASEEILLSGRSDNSNDPSTLLSFTAASGSAGNLNITTPRLTIENGAEILSSDRVSPTELSPDEAGTGNITINASELVTVKGVNLNQERSQLATESFVGNGGTIQINTEGLEILDGGQVTASTFGEGQGGTIEVNASEAVEVVGIGISNDGFSIIRSALVSRSQPNATGNAGELRINTNNLFVRDGADISVSTLGGGLGGNLIVNANESVQIIGISGVGETASRLIALTQGSEDGGSIEIETGKLLLQDGGQVLAATFSDGKGGSITINASESVEVVGTNEQFGSVINTGSVIDQRNPEIIPTGDAGNLTITTDRLSIRDGGAVAASTFGEGNGGELTVNANSIELIGTGIIITNGENITFPSGLGTRTLGSGDAGSLTINAEDITIRDGASATVSSTDEASGNAGNLDIFTTNLFVANEGEVNVGAEGTGEAGSLTINAQEITLDNGSLTAETRTGDRGNIIIDGTNTLILQNNSEITTNATEEATGGDITITSDVIALLENSSITANAVEGRGGNIQINTQGLFQDPDSEITATSELGIDGTVTINELDVNPAEGLEELPSDVINVTRLVAQNLCAAGEDSEFILTGKGGLAPNPSQARNPEISEVDLVEPALFAEDEEVGKPWEDKEEIVEARGWVINEHGNIELVAYQTDINGLPPQPKNNQICEK